MATTEAHKRGNKKWDNENMSILCCKVRKDYADKFREYAKANGTTVHALIKRYILSVIEEETE